MDGSNRRLLTYLTIAATQLMVILDGNVVTVALPAIRGDLGFGDAALPWVVNAFFVAFAAVLLPAGRLAGRMGSRGVFLTGVALFTLASLWCGLAWDPVSLVIARAVQGAGGGLASAVALGMVTDLFPEPAARGRAFAGLAFVGSAGSSIGLLAGGLLTQLLSWPWVFLLNAPVGLTALVVALRVVAPTPGPGVGGGLVPRALFADRGFALASGVLFTMVMAGMSFQYLTSLYLQDDLGYTPLATGAAFLATSTAVAVGSLGISGRLARRIGAVRTLVVGMLLFLAGMLPMVRLPDGGSYAVDVLGPLVALGLGFGLAMPQATGLAMAAAPASLVAVASSFVNAVQQAGGAVGLFLIASVAVATDRSVGFLLAAVGLSVGTVLAFRIGSRPDPAEGMADEEPARTGSGQQVRHP